MPGPISDDYQGPGDHTPYVPHWCYDDDNPRVCACGHHEGYHNDAEACKGSYQPCLCKRADYSAGKMYQDA